MELRVVITAALVCVWALARLQLSSSHVLDSKISCLDCKHYYDFSGIKVAVKCDKVKKLATATAEENGAFRVELPLDISESNPPPSVDCLAKIIGGPNRLYGKNKNLVSKVAKKVSHRVNSYTTSTPLAFSTSCSLATVDAKSCGLGSSKTIDLPLPPEWGLAPSSYYVPFFPIIGIP
ncbi:putative Integrase, catalytic region [Hibiscus syriacus]|uniref:Integrase, catalytic region n=1 Tax=Hibiscus syriacus TaxID=106335 RepID=A0A6A2YTP6_HIBSY|nr:uncharacterized protein LOC120156861 [Hibiscus syriacus]KAE8682455.1 putative Integrase, catalytic region [Hibiscus syriacus]